jgi:hypothetical protein
VPKTWRRSLARVTASIPAAKMGRMLDTYKRLMSQPHPRCGLASHCRRSWLRFPWGGLPVSDIPSVSPAPVQPVVVTLPAEFDVGISGGIYIRITGRSTSVPGSSSPI